MLNAASVWHDSRVAGRLRRIRGRYVVVLVAVVVLLLAGWCAYRAWQVRSELNAAKSAATELEAALDERDVPAAERAMTSLADHSEAAAEASSGPSWAVLGHLPVVGDDVQAIGTMSDVLADLSGSGLRPLLDVAEAYEDGRFAPRDGKIPVDEIADLQEPVATSAESFDRADERLADLDGSYVGQVEEARDRLADAVDQGSDTLQQAQRAVDLLPPMLGIDGPRHYLLVLQNNAEIRSTGGFPGSTFRVTADHGDIELDTPTAGRLFKQQKQPVAPLTPAERALFGERSGTRFVDTNINPDFPRAAQMMRLMWEEKLGERLDGVLAADPVVLSYLLEGMPPVQAQGVTLTPENAVEELLSASYSRWADPGRQDRFFRDVGAEVFDLVSNVPDPEALVEAMRRGVHEGRILAVATRTDEQDELEAVGMTGSLPASTDQPQVGIYVNDRTGRGGSKLSYYLRAEPEVQAVSCRDGAQVLRAALALENHAPAGGVGLPAYVTGGDPEVPLGTEGLALILMGPDGGRLGGVTVDGKPVRATVTQYRGRPATRVEIDLPAAGTARIGWRMTSAKGQSGDVEVAVTPGVNGEPASRTVASACPAT